jgi:hypothetical protein
VALDHELVLAVEGLLAAYIVGSNVKAVAVKKGEAAAELVRVNKSLEADAKALGGKVE